MTRLKEFDPDVALDKAMHVFWEKGYKATSLRDLLQAMGIQRGSMYGTFGSKENVYLACLERFPQKAILPYIQKIDQANSGIKKIHMLFDLVVEFCAKGEGAHGCMMTNAATEIAPHNKRIAKSVDAMLKKREDLFYKWINEALSQGELKSEVQPRDLAKYLNTFMLGLSVLVRTLPEPKALRSIIQQGLSVLK